MRPKGVFRFHSGRGKGPLLVFIHGLGMSGHFWTNPEKSRILAGNLPLTTLLSEPPYKETHPPRGRITTGSPPSELKSSYHDFLAAGYSLLVYSQKRPAASADILVEELAGILEEYKDAAQGHGMVLIGHSRGGLIARKVIETTGFKYAGLITIGTPHRGSQLARIADALSGIADFLLPLFEGKERGSVTSTVNRLLKFLTSDAIRELLPESDFIKSLNDRPSPGIPVMTVGGTDPSLFKVYRWYENCLNEDEECLMFKEIISFPGILERFLPQGMLPDEFRRGRGDGLVAIDSAQGIDAQKRVTVALNHVWLVYHPEVRREVEGFVGDLI